MDPLVGALIVAIVQVVVGIGNVIAANAALKKDSDLLGEFTIGKASVKLDKTDIVALAFAVFVFWAVSNKEITGAEGVTAFVAVLTGTGVKEFIEAVLPKPPKTT